MLAALERNLLYAKSNELGYFRKPISYVSMARIKKRIALVGSPARHFSPASSWSTPTDGS